MIEFLAIILLTALAEAICTWYIRLVSQNQPFSAALLCAINMVISKAITIESVKNNSFLLAIFIGAFLGTYLVAKYHKIKY